MFAAREWPVRAGEVFQAMHQLIVATGGFYHNALISVCCSKAAGECMGGRPGHAAVGGCHMCVELQCLDQCLMLGSSPGVHRKASKSRSSGGLPQSSRRYSSSWQFLPDKSLRPVSLLPMRLGLWIKGVFPRKLSGPLSDSFDSLSHRCSLD